MAQENNEQDTASLGGLVKATLAGGLLFLLPIILVSIVIGHAIKLMAAIAQPVAHLLPAGSIAGLHSENVLAILLLVLISLLAGLVARTRTGRRIMRWSETSLLGGMPQYQLVKSVAQGMAQVENMEGVQAAFIGIDGGWQIGYLLETLPNGWKTVFVPQAPTPMSGNVMYLPADRVVPLAMPMAQAMTLVKRLGVGSAAALQHNDADVLQRM